MGQKEGHRSSVRIDLGAIIARLTHRHKVDGSNEKSLTSAQKSLKAGNRSNAYVACKSIVEQIKIFQPVLVQYTAKAS